MRDRLTAAEKVRRVVQAFEAGGSPGSLYEALKLIRPLDEAGVRALIDGFGAVEWRAASGCARALGHRPVHPGLAIPALAGLLKHEERLARESAVEALGCYGAPARPAAPAILAAMKREEEAFHVRPFVAALAAIGAPASMVLDEYLRLLENELADDPMGLGATVATAISSLGSEARAAGPMLRRAMKSEDWKLRTEAAVSLLAVEGPPAVPEVMAFLKDRLEFAEHLVGPLRRAGADPHDLVRIALGRVHRALLPIVRDPRFAPSVLIGALSDEERREAAVELLVEVGPRPEILEALRRLPHRRALARLGSPLPPTPAHLELGGRLVLAAPLPYPWTAGSGFVMAGHRVYDPRPSEEWANDGEEFGAIRIDPMTFEVRAIPLPVRFPSRRNGASGAKRQFEPAEPFRGGRLFRMICPFADRRGWGNDNFLFWLGPDDRWAQVIVRGGTWDLAFLDAEAGTRDKDLAKVCHGELRIRPGRGLVSLVADTTPYHLDDWEHSERPIAEMDDDREEAPEAGLEIGETKEGWLAGSTLLPEADDFVRDRMGIHGPTRPLSAVEVGGRLFVRARGQVDWLFVWRTDR